MSDQLCPLTSLPGGLGGHLDLGAGIYTAPRRLQSATPSPSECTPSPESRVSKSGHYTSRTSFENQPRVPFTAESSSGGVVWVEPSSLRSDVSSIAGNAPAYVKQLTSNALDSYGVGNDDCFAQSVGKAIKFMEVNVSKNPERKGRLEASTVSEVVVSKNMLNGAGILHGGCIAYLIDNCCSTPLVVLGLLKSVNGVGVTQGLSICFHSPVKLGTCLRIISTSVSLGGRVMTSRCEIIAKHSGRLVASAHLNKMQPTKLKATL